MPKDNKELSEVRRVTILHPISSKLGSQGNNHGRFFDETRTSINPCYFNAVSRPNV